MSDSIFLIVYDMSATISDKNTDAINKSEGTNYPYGATYQMLYDSRNKYRGRMRVLNGSDVWVLPYIAGRVSIDKESEAIKEYTESEYKDILLSFDDV